MANASLPVLVVVVLDLDADAEQVVDLLLLLELFFLDFVLDFFFAFDSVACRWPAASFW